MGSKKKNKREKKSVFSHEGFFLQECKNYTYHYLRQLILQHYALPPPQQKGREPPLMRGRLHSVLPVLLLRLCRIPNGMSCIKGYCLPQLQVTTSLCAMLAKDPGAPALPEHYQSIASTVYCWEGWAAARSSCNPVIAQREQQTLAVQMGELLLP